MSQREINESAPHVIGAFIGQPQATAPVKVALDSSSCGGAQFPHTLFCGPAGLGKTELANIVAREKGLELHAALGQNLRTGGQVAGFLLAANERDIFFIDEIHEMPKPAQTQLYRAMAEQKVFLSGNVFGFKVHTVALPTFTLLAATTEEYALAKPLRDRFEMVLRFRFYEHQEIAEIVDRRIRQIGWKTEPEVTRRISQRAKGIPRNALRLLKSAQRVAVSQGSAMIEVTHLEQACQHEGIEPHFGLDAGEQAYLKLLAKASVPVQPMTLTAALGLPLATVQNITEAFLLRQGLIQRTPRGRRLTDEGLAFVKTMFVQTITP